MLRLLRRERRLTTPFALFFATVVVLGTLDWWHVDDEDAGQPAFHNHSAHHPRLRPIPTDARAADHCYVCHWLRTLGSGFGSLAENRLPEDNRQQLLAAYGCRMSDLVASLLPARAPPA